MADFTTTLTAARTGDSVTFALVASNGIGITVTENEMAGSYGKLLDLFSELIDKADEVQSAVSA